MDKDSSLDIHEVPEFIYSFLSSNYVAHYLGFYIPNFYDIREFLLTKLETAELGFIKRSFCNFDEKLFFEGFEDKIVLEDIKQIIDYLLKHFSEIKAFFEKKDELFYIELHFQLPFIHKSLLKADVRKKLFSQRKIRFYNTFRQYLRGMFLIIPEGEDVITTFNGNYILKKIPVNDNKIKFYLSYPSQLKDYWFFVINQLLAI